MPIVDGSMRATPTPAGSSMAGRRGRAPSTTRSVATPVRVAEPVPVPQPERFVHVAHRGGRKVSFIPPLSGSRATEQDLASVLQDSTLCLSLASAAQVTVRTVSHGVPRLVSAPVDALASVQPDALLEVRRSVSYVGQRNYAGTIVAPTQWWAWRPAWCESLNERYHYLDLLLAHSVRQLATQCIRLEWRLSTGHRSHTPDALLLLEDGDRLLVDVTTTQRLKSAAARAVFALTAATCRELGWRYEVRSELAMQYQRNLSFLRTFAAVPAETLISCRKLLSQTPSPVGTDQLALVLGDGDRRRGLGLVWALIAAGDLHADLAEPLQPDTVLHHGRAGYVERPWVITA